MRNQQVTDGLARIVAPRAYVRLHFDGLSVRGEQRKPAFPTSLAQGLGKCGAGRRERALVGRIEQRKWPPDCFFGSIAEDAARALVPKHDGAGEVVADNRVLGGGSEKALDDLRR